MIIEITNLKDFFMNKSEDKSSQQEINYLKVFPESKLLFPARVNLYWQRPGRKKPLFPRQDIFYALRNVPCKFDEFLDKTLAVRS